MHVCACVSVTSVCVRMCAWPCIHVYNLLGHHHPEISAAYVIAQASSRRGVTEAHTYMHAYMYITFLAIIVQALLQHIPFLRPLQVEV